jgi:hypothetical protein
VTGKVFHSGKPVEGGTLIFAPVPSGNDVNPGAPVAVPVKADGTFTSGSVLPGRNRVMYNPPPVTLPPGYQPQPSVPVPESPYANLAPRPNEVEVAVGGAPLEIELLPPTPSY